MRYTVPHYYAQFHCTADQCEDTCCAGWQIVIDERTLKRYRKVKGAFGNRLHNSIDWKEGTFQQYDGRCAFLDERNLCDIYTELGPKMFCKTCRTYPRHIEEFPNCREISLSLSCMEAANLVLGCEEPVRFLVKETEREEEEESSFDFFLYDKLCLVRETAIRILQNRMVSIDTRLSMVLALAHDVQWNVVHQGVFEVDSVCDRYERVDAPIRFEKRLEPYRIPASERFPWMQEACSILEQMEVLRSAWTPYWNALRDCLYQDGPDRYAEEHLRFRKTIWDVHPYTEQLMFYFVFTYYCGGVYDGDAYAKMKFAVVSTLLIQELAKGLWKKQGEQLTFHDIVDVAHRYSREVEHSDDNLNRMEEILSKDERFCLENLLRMIG